MSDRTIMIVMMVSGLVTPAIVLVAAIKMWYVLGEYRPHAHTERGDRETLTTDGIVYPRSMTDNK